MFVNTLFKQLKCFYIKHSCNKLKDGRVVSAKSVGNAQRRPVDGWWGTGVGAGVALVGEAVTSSTATALPVAMVAMETNGTSGWHVHFVRWLPAKHI